METTTNLNLASTYVTVVQSGGFTAGARALGIPKSSASRRVRQLEEELGVQLMHRTTRSLRLTDAGREFYERVAGALAAVEEARAAAAEFQDVPKGLVRVAAPSDWASWLLAPVISRFVDAYPDVRIDLSFTGRDVDLVREGFDLALTTGPQPDSSLIVRTIGAQSRGLFASESYLRRFGIPQTLEDLHGHRFVVQRPGPTNRLPLSGKDGVRWVTVSGPVATDDRAFSYEAVRAGLGIGVLAATGCIEHLGIVAVLPEYTLPGFSVQVVYPASRHLPKRVALFKDALIEHLSAGCSAHGTTPQRGRRVKRPTA
jgi:DNA-binding transcriptional LysR family regulator